MHGPKSSLSNAWLMVLASFLFATMGVCVKFASMSYGAGEIVFFRGLICMVLMFALAKRQGHSLRTRHALSHMSYCIPAVATICFYFYAIAHLPLATALALNYTAPVWLGFLLLVRSLSRGHPSADFRLQAAVVLGLVGALLILQPDLHQGQVLTYLAGLLSGFLAAVSYARLPALFHKGEPESRIIFYFTLGSVVAGGADMVAMGTSEHSVESIGWLLSVGFLAAGGQWALTRAYSRGRGPTMACLQYSGIVFAYGHGLIFFGESIEIVSMIGVALVIVAGFFATLLNDANKRSQDSIAGKNIESSYGAK